MNDFKSIFASKTFWGVIVALLATTAAKVYHVNISADDQSQIVNEIIDAVQLVGGAIAIWGRIVATKQVTLTGNPPS